MNLLDIHTHTWSPDILAVSPPQLAEKLGEPAPSYSVAGRVSAYFAKRYGFRDDCKVLQAASEPLTCARLYAGPGTTLVRLLECESAEMGRSPSPWAPVILCLRRSTILAPQSTKVPAALLISVEGSAILTSVRSYLLQSHSS
jgi:hypothetical protein